MSRHPHDHTIRRPEGLRLHTNVNHFSIVKSPAMKRNLHLTLFVLLAILLVGLSLIV